MRFLMQLHYKHRLKGGFIIKEVYNLCRALFYVEENQLRHKTCSRAVYMGNIYNEKQTESYLDKPTNSTVAGQCHSMSDLNYQPHLNN